MSIEAITFVKQLDVANPTSRLLLMVIGENTFNDSLVCRVGQAVLSDETRVPTRTIRDHLRRLRRDGVITIERSKDANGQMQPAAIGLVGFGEFLVAIRQRRKGVSTGSASQGCADVDETPSQRRNLPLASGELSAAGQRRTVAGPYKDSRTSNSRTLSPLPPEQAEPSEARESQGQDGDKQGASKGTTGVQPVEIPVERQGWIDALAADGIALDVVDALIAPLLATLTVPRDVAPVAWLRVWRDAVAAAKPNAAVLAKARELIAVDRVRDLPWPRDLAKTLDAAHAALLVTLQPGDPRWAAWLAHDRVDPAKSAFARTVERNRWAYQADADWPAETPAPAVERLPLGTWSIAWGTPESAAWLCVLRRSDPNLAQSLDLGKATLTKPTRWPEIAP